MPANCRRGIVAIGSLAAAYHFFGKNRGATVRTKDADCLLSPRITAVPTARAVAERLFESGRHFRASKEFPSPGDASTPEEKLPALRLFPPGSTDLFIELSTVPESPVGREQHWVRLETSRGHFGIPCFRFLALVDFEPTRTDLGLAVARPEMMALANLLEHPTIATQTMSTEIGARIIKRGTKDLGRVLAIARLSTDLTDQWPELWIKALENRFGAEWRALALHTGDGLRQLLAAEHQPDFDEAHHSAAFGLLSSSPPTMEQFRITGRRLLSEVVGPLEKSASGSNE